MRFRFEELITQLITLTTGERITVSSVRLFIGIDRALASREIQYWRSKLVICVEARINRKPFKL